MNAYYVKYKMFEHGEEHGVSFLSRNKCDAYIKAVYEEIPNKESTYPYSAWVSSVTYNNGNVHYFNTCEGLPY